MTAHPPLLVSITHALMNSAIKLYWLATGRALIAVVSAEINSWYLRHNMPVPSQVMEYCKREMEDKSLNNG